MERNSEGGERADPASGSDNSGSTSAITVQVKFSGRTIPVTVPIEAAVRELKSLLQSLTNVLPRGQKLIFKGEVLMFCASLIICSVWIWLVEIVILIIIERLIDATGKVLEDPATLRSYQITNGSKIMLVASQGLHQGVIFLV